MLLNDESIKAYCTSPIWLETLGGPMIDPFSEGVSGNGVISWGLSSAGYDIRLGTKIYALKGSFGEVLNPKRFKDEAYRKKVFDERDFEPHEEIIIPANGYILGMSMEYFRMPNTVAGRCMGKSTLARSAILINVTPLEPGWKGVLTVEVANTGPCPVCCFACEGIAQIQFETLVARPLKTYAEKNNGEAKYQGQTGITLAKVL